MQLLLILCLFVTAYAVSETDGELSNFLETGSSAASAAGSAARWLFEQREEWGPFLPRAVVGLAVAEGAGAHSLPPGEWGLMAKQLKVLVSIEVGRDAAQQRHLSESRLSHLVHALLATCQDPRRFHGLDLVGRLRADVDRLSAPAPLAYVALCLAGEATHADLARLSKMYQHSANRTDEQALHLVAMSCISSTPESSSARPIVEAYAREFAARVRNALRRNATDVYTKALAMQALNSVGLSVDAASLLSDQLDDGSFERSPLATYHAIPALLDTSLLALRDARCPAQVPNDRHADDLESSQGVVRVSLWMGEGADRDTHTVTVAAYANHTLLDVMRAAKEKNDIFRFSYDVTPIGARVYSLGGVPNDSERETTWQLFVQKGGERGQHLRPVRNTGLDKVFPAVEDTIIFWYKRD